MTYAPYPRRYRYYPDDCTIGTTCDPGLPGDIAKGNKSKAEIRAEKAVRKAEAAQRYQKQGSWK